MFLNMQLPKPRNERDTTYREVLSWVNTAEQNNALNKWIFSLNGQDQVNEELVGLVSTEYKKLITVSAPVAHFPFGVGMRRMNIKINSSQLRGEEFEITKHITLELKNTFWRSSFHTYDFNNADYRVGSFNLSGQGILFIEDIIEGLTVQRVVQQNPENKYSFGDYSLDHLFDDTVTKNSKAFENRERISGIINQMHYPSL